VEIIYTLIIGCWVVFFLFIFVAALFTKHTIERQGPAGRLLYTIPLFLAIFLLVNGFGSQTAPGIEIKHPIYLLSVPVLPGTLDVMAIGLILAILGLILGLWARATLGSNWSGSVTFKEDHELIQIGPYTFVRHPIYSAFLLLYLGTAIAIGTIGGFIGFPLLFISCWIKLKQEEDVMIRHFKGTYLEYQKSVKALIPYIL
jgi:isoprenylcysteine carboxyl methyltransferase (ICMT) family protein YpbQ